MAGSGMRALLSTSVSSFSFGIQADGQERRSATRADEESEQIRACVLDIQDPVQVRSEQAESDRWNQQRAGSSLEECRMISARAGAAARMTPVMIEITSRMEFPKTL